MPTSSDAALRQQLYAILSRLGFTDDGSLSANIVKALNDHYEVLSLFPVMFNLWKAQGAIIAGGGGGGAGVDSFNTRTGPVTLTQPDVVNTGVTVADLGGESVSAINTAINNAISALLASIVASLLPSPTGAAGKVVTVNTGGTGYELDTPAAGINTGLGALSSTSVTSSRNAVTTDLTKLITCVHLTVPIAITIPLDSAWSAVPPVNSIFAIRQDAAAQASLAFAAGVSSVGVGPSKCAQQGSWLFAVKTAANVWNYFGQNAVA